MRLWHYKLIPHLPRQQLLGQHRECCAMRGMGWGRKHSTEDYVWEYHYTRLCTYHFGVISEMKRRRFSVCTEWLLDSYRGKRLSYDRSDFTLRRGFNMPYPEHDEEYLQECLDNLAGKGIIINLEDIGEPR